jgi:hypothetical protein
VRRKIRAQDDARRKHGQCACSIEQIHKSAQSASARAEKGVDAAVIDAGEIWTKSNLLR